MNYSDKIKERFSGKFTITVKPVDGDEFDMESVWFEAFCISIVQMASEDSTYISNESLKDLRRWVSTIICTNCGEIGDGLNEALKDSGYKRFYDGLLQSANKVSIETHKTLP